MRLKMKNDDNKTTEIDLRLRTDKNIRNVKCLSV